MPRHNNVIKDRLDSYHWRIPQSYAREMAVPVIIYGHDRFNYLFRSHKALQQLTLLARLTGVVKSVVGFSNLELGYGFPTGSVAALDVPGGWIVPAGVGSDIGDGVRLMGSALSEAEVRPVLKKLVETCFRQIPTGLDQPTRLKLSDDPLLALMTGGARRLVDDGYAVADDLSILETNALTDTEYLTKVPENMLNRARNHIGTLGAGDHFVKIVAVAEVLDFDALAHLNLQQDSVAVVIHAGSRGVGFQAFEAMQHRLDEENGQDLAPDSQLKGTSVVSDAGRYCLELIQYALNFAQANRQMLTYLVRDAFETVFNQPSLKTLALYPRLDVSHNTIRRETHIINQHEFDLWVHRKGAVRAVPAQHASLSPGLREIGQPFVLFGGMEDDMYLMAAGSAVETETFGSIPHRTGREVSRGRALKVTRGQSLQRELSQRGIQVRARDQRTLREEVSQAYQDLDVVVEMLENTKLARKIARLKPLGIVQG